MSYGVIQNSGSIQVNAGILGGIITGSSGDLFLGLPVSGAAGVFGAALPVEDWIDEDGPKRQLSASFLGHTGSIIQSLNFLQASINASNDAAGSDTQVQYNKSGEFGAEAGFTYTEATDTLAVVNVNLTKMTASGDVQIDDILQLADSKLTIGGTAVTSTGTELNYVDVASIGTAEASKAMVVDGNKDIDGLRTVSLTNLTASGDVQIDDILQVAQDKITIGGTAVTSTAAEINLLDTAAANTVLNSKAVIYSAAGALTGTAITSPSGNFLFVSGSDVTTNKVFLRGTEVTSTAAELNFNDGATAGTAVGSKTVVLDSDKDVTGIRTVGLTNLTASGDVRIDDILQLAESKLTIGGTVVSSTAAELNYVDVTAIGTAEASKALVVDADKQIDGLYAVSSTHVTGTMTVSGQGIFASSQLSALGDFSSAGVTTITSLTASGLANIGSITGTNGILSSAGIQATTFVRAASFIVGGTNAAGNPQEYTIDVIGGMLRATES